MKFIIGSLKFRPGTRDAFIAEMQPIVTQIRAEPGCLFFEFNPKVDEPDTGVLCECFVDDAAHREHKATPYMQDLFARFGDSLVSGETKVHFADELFEDL